MFFLRPIHSLFCRINTEFYSYPGSSRDILILDMRTGLISIQLRIGMMKRKSIHEQQKMPSPQGKTAFLKSMAIQLLLIVQMTFSRRVSRQGLEPRLSTGMLQNNAA